MSDSVCVKQTLNFWSDFVSFLLFRMGFNGTCIHTDTSMKEKEGKKERERRERGREGERERGGEREKKVLLLSLRGTDKRILTGESFTCSSL